MDVILQVCAQILALRISVNSISFWCAGGVGNIALSGPAALRLMGLENVITLREYGIFVNNGNWSMEGSESYQGKQSLSRALCREAEIY